MESNNIYPKMNRQHVGILFGLAAFLAWGFLPAYWKQLQDITPFEVLCHRIVWSCIFLCMIIGIQKRWVEVSQIIRGPGNRIKLCGSGILIAVNWFIYIWAVNSDHVVETSLGYYISPMFNVGIGFLLLRERFSRLQSSALLFAIAGIGYSLFIYGKPPLFALTLAVSFAFYGYARKKISVAPIPGLLVETFVLFIPALGYLFYREYCDEGLFGHQLAGSLWLIGSGIVTSLPLLWFSAATKNLKLSTVGIMQYLAPTIAFALGVFVYQEPFDRHNIVTFILIWTGVIVFCIDTILRSRHLVPK
jgi:chloramphenicol-sensitive protein RarD